MQAQIDAYLNAIPEESWPDWVIGGHDKARIASKIGQAQARILAVLLMTLRGTPFLFAGDEIGTEQIPVPADQSQDIFEKLVSGYGLSRGRGPIELHGSRNGPRSMRVTERIHRRGGGRLVVPTRGMLHFTDVGAYFGGSYWKVHQLARFELRRVGPKRRIGRVVRVGPKHNYCLRDLVRTRPGRRSPVGPHYPGCNQNPYADAVTLGTSVGWSDVYPGDYDKQWIPVGGLRGCFAFVMTVDPQHLLYESNERDNSAHRLIRLPYRGKPGC